VNVALLDPLAIVTGLAGVKVTVPVEELDKLTLIVASLVFGLLYWSCRCTVMLADATPAVTVTGDVVNTSLLADAGFTVSCCVASVSEPLCAVTVGVPALVSV
jgi:hypothetical protein